MTTIPCLHVIKIWDVHAGDQQRRGAEAGGGEIRTKLSSDQRNTMAADVSTPVPAVITRQPLALPQISWSHPKTNNSMVEFLRKVSANDLGDTV